MIELGETEKAQNEVSMGNESTSTNNPNVLDFDMMGENETTPNDASKYNEEAKMADLDAIEIEMMVGSSLVSSPTAATETTTAPSAVALERSEMEFESLLTAPIATTGTTASYSSNGPEEHAPEPTAPTSPQPPNDTTPINADVMDLIEIEMSESEIAPNDLSTETEDIDVDVDADADVDAHTMVVDFAEPPQSSAKKAQEMDPTTAPEGSIAAATVAEPAIPAAPVESEADLDANSDTDTDIDVDAMVADFGEPPKAQEMDPTIAPERSIAAATAATVAEPAISGAIVDSELPAPVDSELSAPVESDPPAPVESDPPAPVESDPPAPVEAAPAPKQSSGSIDFKQPIAPVLPSNATGDPALPLNESPTHILGTAKAPQPSEVAAPIAVTIMHSPDKFKLPQVRPQSSAKKEEPDPLDSTTAYNTQSSIANDPGKATAPLVPETTGVTAAALPLKQLQTKEKEPEETTTATPVPPVDVALQPVKSFRYSIAGDKKTEDEEKNAELRKRKAATATPTTQILRKKRVASKTTRMKQVIDLKGKAIAGFANKNVTATSEAALTKIRKPAKKATPKKKTAPKVKAALKKKATSKAPTTPRSAANEVECCVPDDKVEGGWPKGWLRRKFKRLTGASAGTFDRYWYSPKTGKKFRSMAEIKRFLPLIKEKKGDEEAAWLKFKGK